jgi:hypothetical protein
MTAPARRRFAATVESCAGGVPTRASDPAVVCIRSPVSMFALRRIGIPCSGPRTCPALRSASSWRAIASASGLSSITERTSTSRTLIRALYFWTSASAVRPPVVIAACNAAIVVSSSSGAGAPASALPARASDATAGAVATAAVAPTKCLRSKRLDSLSEPSSMLPPSEAGGSPPGQQPLALPADKPGRRALAERSRLSNARGGSVQGRPRGWVVQASATDVPRTTKGLADSIGETNRGYSVTWKARPEVSETDPIRVFTRDGKWLVDYGSYAHGYHLSRSEAIQTATRAARDESRELVVEPD